MAPHHYVQHVGATQQEFLRLVGVFQRSVELYHEAHARTPTRNRRWLIHTSTTPTRDRAR